MADKDAKEEPADAVNDHNSEGPEEGDVVYEGEEEEEATAKDLIGCCIACCVCLVCCIPALLTYCCCKTASTAINKAQGKRWDAKQRAWIIDNIEEEAKTLEGVPEDDADILKMDEEDDETDAKKEDDKPTEGADVVETEYYDELGVPPDADESKIKRAYYIKARKYHPDKNDSEEAKEKFQKIGEAYAVLSDPKLRTAYDKKGKDGLSGDRTEISSDSVDPSLIFTMLFGNDQFASMIGRLQVVTSTLAEHNEMDGLTSQDMYELERRRVVRLAVALVNRTDKFVNGQESAAEADWKAEAAKLVESRYGEEILNLVGKLYKLYVQQQKGTWREGLDAKADEVNLQMDAAMKAQENVDAMTGQGQEKQGDGDKDDDDNEEQGEDPLPHYIHLMWQITVIDITSTLREVVFKVLNDVSVEKAIREKRAEAIKTLGDIFESTKSTSEGDEKKSVRHLFQSATQAAMEETMDKAKKEEQDNEAE